MKSFIVAAAVAFVASPAFASSAWTATPAKAASKQDFVAGSVIWSCNSSGCHSTSDPSGADALTSCRELGRQLGQITAFSANGRVFTAENLAACNVSAKH